MRIAELDWKRMRREILLKARGASAHRSPCTRNNNAIGYGRRLAWLAHNGILDAEQGVAERATEAAIERYVADLRSRYASTTVVAFVVSLLSALTVMAPKQDWTALRETINGLKRFAAPARDKHSRIVEAYELRDFGEELMARADAMDTDSSWRRPVMFRDGLMIALLA
ncbi:MAG: hypothetical protein JSR21_20340, partial [Proteobacteria bacterium]|nr:hypothetical protein [Pseudomonadota bacterium]